MAGKRYVRRLLGLGSSLGEDERMVGRLLVQFLEAMQYNTHSALEMVRAAIGHRGKCIFMQIYVIKPTQI